MNKNKGFRILSFLLLAYATLAFFCGIGYASRESKILEAEILGAEKLAPMVSKEDLTERQIIAWLWEEPVVYSDSAKVPNMVPKKLNIPQNMNVPPTVIDEGRWLISHVRQGLRDKADISKYYLHREAWRTFYQGNLEKSMALYEKIPGENHNFWTAFRLGEYWSSKDIKKSNAYFQMAYRKLGGKVSSDFAYRAGNIAYLAQDYSKAIEFYTVVLTKTSKDGLVYLYRGNAHFSLDQLDSALKDYEAGALIAPNKADFYINRARIYGIKKNISAACIEYQRYLQLVPKDTEVWYEFIDYATENKQKSIIKSGVEQWISAQPNEARAWKTRGDIFFEENKYIDALRDYKKATSLNPKLATAWYNQALCLENIGFPESASTDKKWEHLQTIQNCYEKFLQYADKNAQGRDRAQKRINEIKKYSGQVLDI